jgi:glutathione peroxidase-family protein
MMISIIKTTLVLAVLSLQTSIYSIEVSNLNGTDQSLNAFRNKKILVVLLPTSETTAASHFLQQLDSLSKAQAGKLAVIAIPSYEDGFTQAAEPGLQQWYNQYLSNQVLITRGMYSRKSSPGQHPLLQWLTHQGSNGHFDEEAGGAGQVYLVNETGELMAVLSPGISLSGKTISRLLQ